MHKNYREGPSYDQRDPKRQKSEYGRSVQQFFPAGDIKLTANFFRLSFNVGSIYQYHVEFQPEIESRAMRRAMFYQHQDKTGPQFLHGEVLFLQRDSKDLKFESTDREGRKYIIAIKKTKEIIPSEHNNAEELRHIFNNILKEVFRTSGLADLGKRGFLYDLRKTRELTGYKLDVMLGYSTAVQTLKGGIFLNVAAVSKIIRKDTALEIAKRSPNLLKGRYVMTGYTKKTYKVNNVDSTKSPLSTFPVRVTRLENGKKIKEERQTTFLDYYYERYKVPITDKRQPLLEVIQKRNGVESTIYLIPELVYLTGLEDTERSDFHLKIALSKITIRPPDERMRYINDFARNYVTSLKETKKGEIPSWNIKTVSEPVSFNGRKLEKEVVFFRDHKFEGETPDWKNLYTAKYFNAPALRKWRIFSLRDEREDKRNFLEVFRRTLGGYGIEVGRPTEHEVHQVRDFEAEIDRYITEDDEFIMVIFPKRMEREYQAVKALLCGRKPIPSQIVCTSTFTKGKGPQAVCNKLAAQITGKLGGIPWQVDVSKFCEAPIMVCGLTTGPTSRGGTVVTLTASYTQDMAQYMSFSEFQDSKEITCLEKLLRLAGEQFRKETDNYPSGVIVFREGVGEGSLDKFIKEELKQVAIVAQQEAAVYIIVNKKTNTRFFVNQSGQFENPPSGTVVDEVIVKNPAKFEGFGVFDFYLVAQTSNQGTVSPSHYIVYNKSTFDRKDIESLAYKLTHTYYNWTGTVAVPSPLMNARKLANLLSQKSFVPQQKLSGKLYFL